MMEQPRAKALSTMDVNGLRIAWADAGSGTPVLLAHCSSASHRAWAALVPRLTDRYRVMAPDLIGYGSSDSWPRHVPFDPMADVNVLLALAEEAGGPVHLVGHSYGGATALEAARILGDRVISLTLIEPVAFHVLALAGRSDAWIEVSEVARRVRELCAKGREREAAAVYMRYWIGNLRWWLMPAKQRTGIVSTVRKVAAEFGIMRSIRTELEDYAGINAPVRFVLGSRTRRAARAVTEVLLETLPEAETRIIAGAGHMSPFTHRDHVVPLIAGHIDACERLHAELFPSLER